MRLPLIRSAILWGQSLNLLSTMLTAEVQDLDELREFNVEPRKFEKCLVPSASKRLHLTSTMWPSSFTSTGRRESPFAGLSWSFLTATTSGREGSIRLGCFANWT
jgi:hypothetical protein